MKLCFYPHMTSLNRGCEAIIVSTCQIFDRSIGTGNIKTLLEGDENDDRRLIGKSIDSFQHFEFPYLSKYSVSWFNYQISKFVRRDPISYLSKRCRKDIRRLCSDQELLVSIGGDNYCYGKPYALYAMHKCMKSMRKATVLWGCSIEPDSMDYLMIHDLSTYDLIVARESITYEALISNKLSNAVLCADPAFILPAVSSDILGIDIADNTVGINISPMIIDHEQEKGMVKQNYIRLIQHILEKTQLQIALIPHVTVDVNDDREPLNQLFEIFKDSGRIYLIDDHNCMEIKGIISRCRMFIGARTHATIAAYSSCVPTLVVGYSVKSKGIAKDIFGTYENYVLPVQSLQEEDELTNSFIWLNEHEEGIRKHLKNFMPEYIEKAWAAGTHIVKLLADRTTKKTGEQN